jgi:hypothetical protein
MVHLLEDWLDTAVSWWIEEVKEKRNVVSFLGHYFGRYDKRRSL